LAGCATAGFEAGGFAACLPVVEYGRVVQQRAADEIVSLPQNAVIVGRLSDYA